MTIMVMVMMMMLLMTTMTMMIMMMIMVMTVVVVMMTVVVMKMMNAMAMMVMMGKCRNDLLNASGNLIDRIDRSTIIGDACFFYLCMQRLFQYAASFCLHTASRCSSYIRDVEDRQRETIRA